MCFNILCLISCKYESEDLNFHEIKQPDKSVKVTMNLADIPSGQTIYIYASTDLLYAINTTSGSIAKQEFYLNNKLIGSEKEVLHLNPSDLIGNGSDVVKVKLELSSGTGSLAEVLGEEKSSFEFIYPIKYVNPQVNLNINQRINSSNKLEIYWKKPNLEGAEIESYEIYNFNNLDQILIDQISDHSKTSFVDDDYSYGAKTYKIITKYKGNKVPAKEDFYSVKYKVFTSNYFKTSTLKNLNLDIKWTHPDGIENKYVLVWKENVLTIPLGKNNAEVYRPAFPFQEEQYYELYILPEKADTWDYAKYPKVINYFKEQKYGDTEIDNAHLILVEGDVKNNLILSMRGYKNGYGIRNYGIDDLVMKSKNPDLVQYPYYISSFKVSPATGKVAVHLRSDVYETKPKIEVYSDFTFSKKIRTYASDDFPVYYLTNDDKILVGNNNLYHYEIYDLNSGKLLSEKREANGQFFPGISADGRYATSSASYNNGWYKIYRYENDQYKVIAEKTGSRTLNAIEFHPLIQDQVVLQSIDNYFTICELPSLKVIKKVAGEFICFDKFTGKILFKDENFSSNSLINVMDSKYSTIVFSMTTGLYFHPYEARLLNNNIILNNNYVNIGQ
ncbi:hypothetical protein ACFX5U_11670 [Sphingobacterium sp. SG20118]|uniref:hypothetical protein n=1 Tax=Sphingobacterium sp. SG20118 TaxID=3367156 RepID=UPI0037DFC338